MNAAEVSKPLAAYRLGLYSRAYSMWHQRFRESADFDAESATNVHLTIERLSQALVTLAAEIPTNLFGPVRETLISQNEIWAETYTMVWEAHTNSGNWNQATFERACQATLSSVSTWLDVAFNPMVSLHGWYRLGVAVAEFETLLSDPSAGLPGTDNLVAACRALPIGPEFPEILMRMARLVSQTTAPSTLTFLTQVIDPERYAEVGETHFDWAKVGPLTRELDHAIQDSLQALSDNLSSVVSLTAPLHGAGEHSSSIPSGAADANLELDTVREPQEKLPADQESSDFPIPSWTKERDDLWVGELRVGNQIVRQVKKIAKNIIVILDVFQEAGWPYRITDPLPNANAERKHDAIRSLNTTLRLIRFRADGSGEAIRWEWINDR